MDPILSIKTELLVGHVAGEEPGTPSAMATRVCFLCAQDVLIDIQEELAEEAVSLRQIDASLTAAATESTVAVGAVGDEEEALLHRHKSPEPEVRGPLGQMHKRRVRKRHRTGKAC
jgi:hypothetical protein